MKKVAILGATGSIGVNSLQVVDQVEAEFQVVALSTHTRVDLLYQQASKYRPQVAAVTGVEVDAQRRAAFRQLGVELLIGKDSLTQLARTVDYDLLVNAVVGAIGFLPTLAGLERGKNIALANKETMVMAGELVNRAAAEHNAMVLPIDSEHSAIFQCLWGEDPADIEAILLTGSGGPFRTLPGSEFDKITVAQALKHPNWSMGKKITIDSATMMNKGLEIIEAHWLFHTPAEKIRVVVHPQSVVHSMVLFCDGSIKAQLGLPDMRVAIQVAMTWPKRQPSTWPRMDFERSLSLSFEPPDREKFPSLDLAYEALKMCGTAPAVLNAANEAAVQMFLNERISFPRIFTLIDRALHSHRLEINPTAEQLLLADAWAREFVFNSFK